MITKELKRFFENLRLELADKDILDPQKTVDEIVEERFDCPTPKIREQIKARVEEWRKNGKVNWKEKIEV